MDIPARCAASMKGGNWYANIAIVQLSGCVNKTVFIGQPVEAAISVASVVIIAGCPGTVVTSPIAAPTALIVTKFKKS